MEFDENGGKFSKRLEHTVGKGEITLLKYSVKIELLKNMYKKYQPIRLTLPKIVHAY